MNKRKAWCTCLSKKKKIELGDKSKYYDHTITRLVLINDDNTCIYCGYDTMGSDNKYVHSGEQEKEYKYQPDYSDNYNYC